MLLNPSKISFSMIDMNAQCIHGAIRVHSTIMSFNFTTAYGIHTINDRKVLWEKIRDIEGIQNGPWMIMGDLNTVLYDDDRTNGTPIEEEEVRDLRDLLWDMGLSEL